MHDILSARQPAPQLQPALSQRLARMRSQFREVGIVGTGLTQDDIEEIGRELQDFVRTARELEAAKRANANLIVSDAYEMLHQAEEAIAGARSALRERLAEQEIDPTGSIRAALGHGVAMVAKVERLIGGRLAS